MFDPISLLIAHPFLSLFSVLIFYTLLTTYLAHRRLSHIPGPTLAGWSIIWLLRASLCGQTAPILTSVTKRYGRLARIGPDHLLTSDPAIVRRMSAVRSPYRKSYWYGAMKFKPRNDNLLSMRDEKVHEVLRKKMASAYGGKENPGIEAIVDVRIADAVSLIEGKYLVEQKGMNDEKAGKEGRRDLEFAHFSQYFTTDVIASLAFGEPWGDLEADEDKYGYIQMSEDNMPVITAMALLPSLLKFFEWSHILDVLSPSTRDKAGLGVVLNATGPIIDERLSGEVRKDDMLGAFIRNGLSREELLSESTLQVLAGSDTTATVIRVAILHLSTNAAALSKLRAEFGGANISSPITDAEARSLPYLQAVIKESMRILPPVTGLFSKEVPPEGDEIDGYHVPGGTIISWSAQALHRDSVYGPDPHLFIPERWTDAPAETYQAMAQTVDLCFGYGKYKCLGSSVALLELNKVLVELLRRFDFTIANPEQPWRSNNAGLWQHTDFYVRVTRRA